MAQNHRRLRLVLQPLVVLLLAAAAAGLTGGLAIALFTAGADPSDGWADLAAVIVGILVGVVTGVVLWFVGLGLLSRRLFPRGRRAGAVVLAALAVALPVTARVLLGRSFDSVTDVVELAALVLVLVVPVAPSVVFLLWDRRPAPLVRGPGTRSTPPAQ